LNDSTDIDLSDENQAEQKPKMSVSGRVTALVVLLILLLLGCGLLWPVPEAERIVDDPKVPDRAYGRAGSLELERVDVSVAEEIYLGRKGVAVVVSMALRSEGKRVFDPGWARLEFPGGMVPPLSRTHEGVSTRSSYPATLEADTTASISLVFAAPKESHDTTLVIQPGDLPFYEALEHRLDLPGGP